MNLRKIASDNRIVINALIIDIIAAIIVFVLWDNSWGLGLLYGNLVRTVNFLFITFAARKYIRMDAEGAKLAAQGSYLARMVFIAVAIVALKFIPAINVWFAMLGFIPLRIALYLESFIIYLQEKRGEKHGS